MVTILCLMTEPPTIRLPPDLKDALRRAADDDGRSINNMAVHILTKWLREVGYLNEGSDR